MYTHLHIYIYAYIYIYKLYIYISMYTYLSLYIYIYNCLFIQSPQGGKITGFQTGSGQTGSSQKRRNSH